MTIGLLSCNPDKLTEVATEREDFTTTEDSKLFFKNMRQSYYELEEHAPTKRHIYRLDDRVTEAERPILNLMIVHDWRNDRAYLMLEPNAQFPNPHLMKLKWTSAADSGTYSYKQGNMPAQFAFATQLYNSLLKEHKLYLQTPTGEQPLFAEEAEREAFRVTMVDYYRLINAYR
jgi:hypothetical protein